jgi:hypothetical protein
VEAEQIDGIDPDMGECCACRGTGNVRNILMHNRRAPVPGTGWGCVVCHLPMDGAISILCDTCVASGARPLTVCDGFPVDKKRKPVEALDPAPFDHDMKFHDEDVA